MQKELLLLLLVLEAMFITFILGCVSSHRIIMEVVEVKLVSLFHLFLWPRREQKDTFNRMMWIIYVTPIIPFSSPHI